MENGERLGPRLVAFSGLWLLLSALLLALSFVVVAVVALAALLAAGVAVGALWFLRRLEVAERLDHLVLSASRVARRFGRRARALEVRRRFLGFGHGLGSRSRQAASAAPGLASDLAARGLGAYALAVYRSSARISQLLRAVESSQREGRSHALRLNRLGAQLRRRGHTEQAVEQHRVALEIVRDLGDEQAEALTLNNLALALAQAGAEAEAVEHLEHALGVLRDLGDERHEARVIANLGIVYRRWGHSEEAVNYLHQALDRLPPESPAYRKVQEELQRAS